LSKRLENRVALITGASRGIGAAVARRFSLEGAHPIVVARTQGALEKLDDDIRTNGGAATLVPLDLLDGAAVDKMAGLIAERFGKLDILVGNAAILGQLSPMSHYDPKTWTEVVATNLHANWRLIRNFDALLRQSDAGRAIFVTSSVARKTKAYWGPYAASKAALEKMVRDWSLELKQTNVRANIIDPGRVRTNMRKQAYPGENSKELRSPESITDSFVKLASAQCESNGEIFFAYQ